MSFSSLTLHRDGAAVYQLTLWPDGVARWDGEVGVARTGAWRARFPARWAEHLVGPVGALPSRSRRSKSNGAVVTLVVEHEDGRKVSLTFDPSGCKEEVWALVTLMEGIGAQLAWSPLDDGGVRVHLRQSRCLGVGRWYPDGRLVVEAGSRASSAEVPSLTREYRRSRQRLLDEGVLALADDHLVFSREHVFNSASHAATILTGHNTSGPREWRSEDGRRLRHLMDDHSTSTASS